MSKAKSAANKETNELLDNLSKGKETTSTEQALYVANGLVVSLAPVYLYVTIFGLSFRENAIAFLALTALVGFLLSKAYEAVTTNVYNAFSRSRNLSFDASLYGGGELKAAKKNKMQELSAEKTTQQETSRHEAISFSILYNNLLFLAFVVVLAFFVLKNLPGLFNYMLSVGVAGALVMLSSTSKYD